MLHLQIDFWNVFDIFCEVKWRHVGIKKRGRVGNDFSKIFVGCEGQVGWPNRAKRGPKHLSMFEKSASERGYGPPWGAWGPSWGRGAVLGRLNARGVRRGSADLGALGALLAPSWRRLGLQNRFWTVKESVPTWIKILKPSKIDVGSHLGGFWEGKWKHVGT